MDASVLEAADAIRNCDWACLGELCDINAGLMAALGVVPADLAVQVERLCGTPGIHGAKLSGAGMGDCIVGIGETSVADRLELAVTSAGVEVYDDPA